MLLRSLRKKLNLFRIQDKSSTSQQRRFVAVFMVAAGFVSAVPCEAADQNEVDLYTNISKIPEMIIEGELIPTDVPNPHWRDDACKACHISNPESKQTQLKDKNVNRLCQNCHDPIFDHSYIHPVDVKPDAKMFSRMPAGYKEALNDSNGKISCTTCHDLPIQCLSRRRSEKLINPSFFRGGPFRARFRAVLFLSRCQAI